MRIGIDARKISDFGIGTYIRGLLGGLAGLGTNDQYVAFAPPGAEIPSGVEHVVVEAAHYSLRELVVVGRAATRAKLDVFHAPHYVVPFTGVPMVVTIHDLIHLHQPMRNPLAPIYARAMIGRAIRTARVILTVTEAVKRQLEEELGAKDVIVTPNGTNAAQTANLPDRPPPTGNSFLYVGNDKPHKNVDLLVEAFALVRAKLPHVALILAGATFDRFRSRNGVIARGFVSDDELTTLYDDAIALVMPSREEGFGLPALEAMARATPVITSLDAALVEVTGVAALHVDAGDARALAEAMLRVANDATVRDAMRSRGVERARFFTWKRCAELTRNAYERAR